MKLKLPDWLDMVDVIWTTILIGVLIYGFYYGIIVSNIYFVLICSVCFVVFGILIFSHLKERIRKKTTG